VNVAQTHRIDRAFAPTVPQGGLALATLCTSGREDVVAMDTPDGLEGDALEEVFYPRGRIPFVEWREFSGARPAVAMTAAVTLLSFVTGLSNLSRSVVVLDGPLAAVLPMAAVFARFAGVLFAATLALATVGLGRRLGVAWLVAVGSLVGLAALPLTTLAPTDVPLLLAIVISLGLLVRNRESFDQSLELSPLQVASLSAVLAVGIYGTVGAYGLRGQFLELDGWGDALYYVIVTVATVGYGDITPTTPEAKLFSLSLIVFGTGAFTVAVGSLIGPAIESRMASAFGNMTASELTLLEDHVVVLGYGDVTGPLLTELDGTDLVVVTPDTETASSLKSEDINVLTGDPTDESVLKDARLDAARGVVVGGEDDATSVLCVLAARNVGPDVRIVAAAHGERHVDKLRTVGADEVVNPWAIGGRLLGRSVLDDSTPAGLFGEPDGERESEAESESG
jgi:voltage-gated potassium channel